MGEAEKERPRVIDAGAPKERLASAMERQEPKTETAGTMRPRTSRFGISPFYRKLGLASVLSVAAAFAIKGRPYNFMSTFLSLQARIEQLNQTLKQPKSFQMQGPNIGAHVPSVEALKKAKEAENKRRAEIIATEERRRIEAEIEKTNRGFNRALEDFKGEAERMSSRKRYIVTGGSRRSIAEGITEEIGKTLYGISLEQKKPLTERLTMITKRSRAARSGHGEKIDMWSELGTLEAVVIDIARPIPRQEAVPKQGKVNSIVYLTIDDAPSADFRHKVDYLSSHGIPATFFCLGSFMEQRPDDIIYAIKKGFVIGNHSYRHPRFSALSIEEVRDEIEKTDAIIEELYRMAGVKRTMKVFRFPYGDRGGGIGDRGSTKEKKERIEAIQTLLKRMSYSRPGYKGINYRWWRSLRGDVDTYWTYDTRDFDRNGKKKETPNFIRSNNIVLIHDSKGTAKAFEKEIDQLMGIGVKFGSPGN